MCRCCKDKSGQVRDQEQGKEEEEGTDLASGVEGQRHGEGLWLQELLVETPRISNRENSVLGGERKKKMVRTSVLMEQQEAGGRRQQEAGGSGRMNIEK